MIDWTPIGIFRHRRSSPAGRVLGPSVLVGVGCDVLMEASYRSNILRSAYWAVRLGSEAVACQGAAPAAPT
ncbi:hypothetical protein GCM10010256_46600 [Streptomyces coeruleorubidus]|nr:hypothetical protein GCM10010256_46600 [Streptomyces coeruleorubidus]